jgi:hypothetical protein
MIRTATRLASRALIRKRSVGIARLPDDDMRMQLTPRVRTKQELLHRER